jgi:hypothetical protein
LCIAWSIRRPPRIRRPLRSALVFLHALDLLLTDSFQLGITPLAILADRELVQHYRGHLAASKPGKNSRIFGQRLRKPLVAEKRDVCATLG